MKYVFFINLKYSKYKWYIKLCKDYELQVHPNIGDQINVDAMYFLIEEISHEINEDEIQLYLKFNEDHHWATDSSEKSKKELIDLAKDLKEYEWRLIDYDIGNIKCKETGKLIYNTDLCNFFRD
jgi:uncharacterized protein YueI